MLQYRIRVGPSYEGGCAECVNVSWQRQDETVPLEVQHIFDPEEWREWMQKVNAAIDAENEYLMGGKCIGTFCASIFCVCTLAFSLKCCMNTNCCRAKSSFERMVELLQAVFPEKNATSSRGFEISIVDGSELYFTNKTYRLLIYINYNPVVGLGRAHQHDTASPSQIKMNDNGERMKFCPNCGQSIGPDHKFCTQCQRKIA